MTLKPSSRYSARPSEDPVPDEEAVAPGGDELQEPADDDVAHNEGDNGGQGGFRQAVGAADPVLGDDLVELVEAAAEDGGDGQQEGVAGRGFAGVAHEQAGGDGAAGAGNARDQRHGLGQAVQDSVLVAELGQVAFLAAHGVGHGEDHAEHNERGGNDPQAAQHRFDLVLEQQAEDDDGQAAQDDEPAHPGVRILPGHLAGQGAEPGLDDPDDVVPEVDDHGRLGAQLGDGGKCRAGIGTVGQERANDPQMGA